MGTNNVIFLEIIEWLDAAGDEILRRIPEKGSGEIKWGAQLIVRESQVGVFFYHGRAIHVFGPGRHTLKTANIPVLNKVMSIPWGMTSPLRAEVYFVNMKLFTGQRWGTRDPVAFKDKELGLIRLRAHGQYAVRIMQPLLFVNSLSGTLASFTTRDVAEYLSEMIVSRLNDYLGEHLDTIFNLPGRYAELSEGLKKTLDQDFGQLGIALPQLYINAVTPPQEVQQAIDDRSKLGLFKDLEDLTRLKAAMSLEKAAENPGGGGQGMAMGLGLAMPAMLSKYFLPESAESPESTKCPDCGRRLPKDAQFCPQCGHQQVVFSRCVACGKNLPPYARFCLRCGQAVADEVVKKKCGKCGLDNLHNSVFCNQCGERL
jgi:membrane protease subunit (stomatin/prohibitin family)